MIWASDRRGPSPRATMPAMRTTDVVVIGGGCIGLACAIALAGRGADVTLLEDHERARVLAGRINSG